MERFNIMGYLFVTGATGLLGSYLIRDLTRAGANLAALVRPTRYESARQRIETAMTRWDRQAGHALPRPVVLEGDLGDPDLGLSPDTRRWVADNCTALVHNAASLTFHAESPEGEPWRSNLVGTRHVLEFCRQTGLRQFHHVSTAYVCGLRQDRVLVSELDVGQQHGNDYEISKFQAEKLVREAGFLGQPTVFRPGIILGDSQTGYTTTFHGFYVPLKLVSTLIRKTAGLNAPRELVVAGIRAAGERLREILQLEGTECKNFVPVDWCSAVMADIITQPRLHGETYHLTPRERVSVRLVQDVMEEAFLKSTELSSEAEETDVDWGEFEKMFLEGMGVYRSYWKNDPTFDSTRTQRAVPHRLCPEIDAAMIARMCRYAIDSNFGWPRPPSVRPEFDVHEYMQPLTSRNGAKGSDPFAAHPQGDIHDRTSAKGSDPVSLGLQVTGSGGGQWELVYEKGRIVSARQGLAARATAMYYMNSNTFRRLAERASTVKEAIQTGRVVIEGNGVPQDELARVLASLTGGTS